MGVTLTGTLTVPAERLDEVRAALLDHVRLTRAEPGCLRFDVIERQGAFTASVVFDVSEAFADRAAFDAHQTRAAGSHWAEVTRGLVREYRITED